MSTWHTFNLSSGAIGVCDPESEADPVRRRRWTFGYGFSFAYLWGAWRVHHFPDCNLGEDTEFLESLLARGSRVALLEDRAGLCAHTHHGANFSKWETDTELAEQPAAAAREREGGLPRLGRRLAELLELRAPVKAKWDLTEWGCRGLFGELFRGYNTEAFQRELWDAWEAASGTSQAKQNAARREILLKVQAPALKRYGFPPSLSGAILMVRQTPAEFLYRHIELRQKSWLLEWLTTPEWQMGAPIEDGKHDTNAMATWLFQRFGMGENVITSCPGRF